MFRTSWSSLNICLTFLFRGVIHDSSVNEIRAPELFGILKEGARRQLNRFHCMCGTFAEDDEKRTSFVIFFADCYVIDL